MQIQDPQVSWSTGFNLWGVRTAATTATHRHVEDYVLHLTSGLLERHRPELLHAAGDTGHIEALVAGGRFPTMTFHEAAALLKDGAVVDGGGWRAITRAGEKRLMERVGSPLWLTHWDHQAVPFYQAFSPDGQSLGADLLLGSGELVGCGERHVTPAEVGRGLALHEVDAARIAGTSRCASSKICAPADSVWRSSASSCGSCATTTSATCSLCQVNWEGKSRRKVPDSVDAERISEPG